jgi:N-acetyl-gamma-glutamyl-phosphate reductase
MKDSLNIAIAGATGYVGLELIKILSKHPKVKIVYLCANKSAGKKIYNFDKKIYNKKLPVISKIDKINWNKINIIFTALPNGEAQKISKKIPSRVRLIDLSGDFRLKDFKQYKKWYGIDHANKKLVHKSIYGLTEFVKKKIKYYSIISCPGCYPTSIQIPLVPLIERKMIKTQNIIIDSKSGYSGAGKKLKKIPKNSISAYGVGGHKHMPEIDQQLSIAARKSIVTSFTPHLIPMYRGILSTIYLETKRNYDAKKIHKFLVNYHKKNFFVNVRKYNTPIGTDDVMNTNNCNITVCENRKKNKIIIISAIDNLIKGASGQAVQNMNVAYNFKENLGLV